MLVKHVGSNPICLQDHTPDSLIKCLQEGLSKIPEEYRSAACFDTRYYGDYDSTYLAYSYPEPDDVLLRRIEREIKIEEQHDFDLYQKLKKRFESE
jgi:hypothetical protein